MIKQTNEERGEFSSRWGFILAAAGSAVGLGNIWGFPTQAASNGGGAFVLVYLLMAFCLAYPVLMAELTIGRYSKANPVDAFSLIANGDRSRSLGRFAGIIAVITASLILAFYSIVGGWLIAYVLQGVNAATGIGGTTTSEWLTGNSVLRNLVFTFIFLFVTALIIMKGVKDGIEKWTSRLMPSLLTLILLLTIYVLTLDGAMEGLRVYLVPDFSQVLNVELIVGAMGQAFFSLSLGVGTMLIYGSYVSANENLPSLARSVTFIDIGIAVLAGLLIVPAIYVAQASGIEVYSEAGELIEGGGLIFNILPALFTSMGTIGTLVAFTFFFLLTLAALTSSISMLEVPVAYAVESGKMPRVKAALVISLLIGVVCVIIITNFDLLFDFVVSLTTEYSQPMLGFFIAIYTAWVWSRDKVLTELRSGFTEVETSLFWKIWPLYIKFVCPAAILLVFAQQILR